MAFLAAIHAARGFARVIAVHITFCKYKHRTLNGCVSASTVAEVVGAGVGCDPMRRSTDNSAMRIDNASGDELEQALEFAAFQPDWMTIWIGGLWLEWRDNARLSRWLEAIPDRRPRDPANSESSAHWALTIQAIPNRPPPTF